MADYIKELFESMDNAERGECMDAFVLGYFDPLDYDITSKEANRLYRLLAAWEETS